MIHTAWIITTWMWTVSNKLETSKYATMAQSKYLTATKYSKTNKILQIRVSEINRTRVVKSRALHARYLQPQPRAKQKLIKVSKCNLLISSRQIEEISKRTIRMPIQTASIKLIKAGSTSQRHWALLIQTRSCILRTLSQDWSNKS